MSTVARTSSENVTSRFCNHFSIIQSHHACKMCPNYPGIKLESALGTLEDKIEPLSSYMLTSSTQLQNWSFHVVERTRTSSKCQKKMKSTCKACKNTVFHCQICKFVRFLLPSSSWLLKLPIKPKPRSLYSLLRRANARNVSFVRVSQWNISFPIAQPTHFLEKEKKKKKKIPYSLVKKSKEL